MRQEPIAPHALPFPPLTRGWGWLAWFSTTDHKKIGIMYGAAALVLGAAAWRGIRIVLHRRGHDDERKKQQGWTS